MLAMFERLADPRNQSHSWLFGNKSIRDSRPWLPARAALKQVAVFLRHATALKMIKFVPFGIQSE